MHGNVVLTPHDLRIPGGIMTRASLATTVALSLALLLPAQPLRAQADSILGSNAAIQRYTDKQLENLVSPIALYPDALLAQVLVAATFPDQVEEAARFVRANGTDLIDEQEWDVSVKSVAHYPSALNMMADKADWMATLGRAYAFQSSDVMAAVQRMRRMAAEHGNLVSTPQQQVVREENNYVIVPAQPQVIYVPVYDPVVVYTRPIFSVGFNTAFWSFGVGFPIGSWLSYDCDWRGRRVYYNGWHDRYFGWGGGWRARSRPFIHITHIYVSPRFQTVYVNRNVVRRHIDYRNVDRYGRVHRDTYFGDGRGYSRDDRRRDHDRGGHDIVRTAQPRDRQGTATPDGYRRGNDNRSGPDNRNTPNNPRSRDDDRDNRNAPNNPRAGDNDRGSRGAPNNPRSRDNDRGNDRRDGDRTNPVPPRTRESDGRGVQRPGSDSRPGTRRMEPPTRVMPGPSSVQERNARQRPDARSAPQSARQAPARASESRGGGVQRGAQPRGGQSRSAGQRGGGGR